MKGLLRSSVLFAATASQLYACALTSKSEPLTPRYFSAEPIAVTEEPAVPAKPASVVPAKLLRLGGVRGGSHLRERILYRDRSGALGYYDERRWTERPEDYLRRALARALFEQRGIQRVVSGAAPTLEVELVGFEEIRAAPRRVRVQAVIQLHDERVVQLEETVTVERPVRATASNDEASAVVQALSEALRLSVDYIADRVAAAVPVAAPDDPVPAQPATVSGMPAEAAIEARTVER